MNDQPYSDQADAWKKYLPYLHGTVESLTAPDDRKRAAAGMIELIGMILAELKPGGHHGNLAHNAAIFGKRYERFLANDRPSRGTPKTVTDEKLNYYLELGRSTYGQWKESLVAFIYTGIEKKISQASINARIVHHPNSGWVVKDYIPPAEFPPTGLIPPN